MRFILKVESTLADPNHNKPQQVIPNHDQLGRLQAIDYPFVQHIQSLVAGAWWCLDTTG